MHCAGAERNLAVPDMKYMNMDPTALRIHISGEMKMALDAVGGFRTEHRGLVDVKVYPPLSPA